MKTTLQPTAAAKLKGFSLVEMLVVIAVLGIISAIAVPFVANATEKAGEASHHRTAQMFATMATNAIASGNLTIVEATSAEEVVDMLLVGVVGTGVFDGTVFQVQSLDEVDRVATLALLAWDGGSLQYRRG